MLKEEHQTLRAALDQLRSDIAGYRDAVAQAKKNALFVRREHDSLSHTYNIMREEFASAMQTNEAMKVELEAHVQDLRRRLDLEAQSRGGLHSQIDDLRLVQQHVQEMDKEKVAAEQRLADALTNQAYLVQIIQQYHAAAAKGEPLPVIKVPATLLAAASADPLAPAATATAAATAATTGAGSNPADAQMTEASRAAVPDGTTAAPTDADAKTTAAATAAGDESGAANAPDATAAGATNAADASTASAIKVDADVSTAPASSSSSSSADDMSDAVALTSSSTSSTTTSPSSVKSEETKGEATKETSSSTPSASPDAAAVGADVEVEFDPLAHLDALRARSAEVVELHGLVREEQAKLAVVLDELHSKEQRAELLTHDLERVHKELENLRAAALLSRSAITDEQEATEAVRRELEATQRERRRLMDELSKEEAKYRALVECLAVADGRAAEAEDALREVMHELRVLRSSNTVLQEAYHRLLDERNSLSRRAALMEEDLKAIGGGGTAVGFIASAGMSPSGYPSSSSSSAAGDGSGAGTLLGSADAPAVIADENSVDDPHQLRIIASKLRAANRALASEVRAHDDTQRQLIREIKKLHKQLADLMGTKLGEQIELVDRLEPRVKMLALQRSGALPSRVGSGSISAGAIAGSVAAASSSATSSSSSTSTSTSSSANGVEMR